MHLHEVHRQPCQEYVHDIVGNQELNAQSPELGRTQQLAPRSNLFFTGCFHTAFVDVSQLCFINVRTVLRIISNIFMPSPSQEQTNYTETEEYMMPAKGCHQPYYNSRTNYRTKKAAVKNKGACLALFVFIKPFVFRHSERRINRCFAQAKHQTYNCKGILTACYSS